MYNVIVGTTTSATEYGTQISSTRALHQFLCQLDFQLVTKLEVRYYRELKTPHDIKDALDTGSMAQVTSLISNGPDSWEVSVPETPSKTDSTALSIIK